tara:strand:- start:2590 stop:3918 length:1329 start_codon:yes stop_codon:yes gene_type:complete
MDSNKKNIFYEQILEKVSRKDYKIGIIGMGYVGLPLALAFCKKDITTLGFDINKKIINSLRSSTSYINHIKSSEVRRYVNNKKLIPSENLENINSVDVIIICVPTPLSKNKEPDLTFIKNSLDSIKYFLHKGQILILESTTYPGTTEEILKPFIEREGFKIGKDFFLVYSPEREDPGNKIYKTHNIPKIIGGCTNNCALIAKKIYSQIIEEIIVLSSTRAAEMTKLVENIHRAVNIGLVNELKLIAEELGVDLYEVIRAAATKPFGFMPFFPGPGLGGHCIPIDPYYLAWKSKEFGIHTKFIELAEEINSSMPKYVVSKISNSLNDICKSVKKSAILILGIAYKKNIDDARESPSLEIIDLLIKMGANIKYNDPYFPKFPRFRKYNFTIDSIEITGENIDFFDCVVLLTDHDSFDYELIKNNSKLIIDTRGKYNNASNIIRA